jgi:hypothetical protein
MKVIAVFMKSALMFPGCSTLNGETSVNQGKHPGFKAEVTQDGVVFHATNKSAFVPWANIASVIMEGANEPGSKPAPRKVS